MSGLPKTQDQIERRNSAMHDFLMRSPYAIGAILFHLVLFLMLATWVIFKAPPEPVEATFQGVKIAVTPPPPPPMPPASSGGEAQNALEPDVTVTPPPTAPTVLVSSVSDSFNVNSVKIAMPNLTSLAPAKGTGLSSTGASGSGMGAGSVFGSGSSGANGFVGYFYDLKQSPDHKPTDMNADKEQALVKKFFRDGWNEDDWATKFLKSPAPLYSNELMVPLISSAEGPKAYGLEKVCEPGYWCTIYHLKVNATRTGNYRVAGFGDDFLVVRVDGQVVLDSGWFKPVTDFKREKIFPPQWLTHPSPGRPDYGQTVVGSPFRMNTGEELTIDVFMGDADDANKAGRCGYFLFLLEDGKDYAKDPGGNPLLPVLQVQPNANLVRPGDHPPFTSNPEDALLGL